MSSRASSCAETRAAASDGAGCSLPMSRSAELRAARTRLHPSAPRLTQSQPAIQSRLLAWSNYSYILYGIPRHRGTHRINDEQSPPRTSVITYRVSIPRAVSGRTNEYRTADLFAEASAEEQGHDLCRAGAPHRNVGGQHQTAFFAAYVYVESARAGVGGTRSRFFRIGKARAWRR